MSEYPKFSLIEITQKQSDKKQSLPQLGGGPLKVQGIQLHQKGQGILLKSFIGGILGNPGAGKSTLIQEILLDSCFYGKRFERVLFIGPTIYGRLIQDDLNTRKFIDTNWIYKHIDAANQWGCKSMLLIFDDVISSFKGMSQNRQFIDLFYNRRHLLKNGPISILVSGQKWNMIPPFIRNAYNFVFCFPLARPQAQIMAKQLPFNLNKATLLSLFNGVKKHQFIYFNVQDNKIFNSVWEQL